jgi:hypothetical protein
MRNIVSYVKKDGACSEPDYVPEMKGRNSHDISDRLVGEGSRQATQARAHLELSLMLNSIHSVICSDDAQARRGFCGSCPVGSREPKIG